MERLPEAKCPMAARNRSSSSVSEEHQVAHAQGARHPAELVLLELGVAALAVPLLNHNVCNYLFFNILFSVDEE
jgi:hypothetical protein